MATIFPLGSQFCAIGPVEVPGSSSEVGAAPFLPSRPLDVGAGVSSPGGIPSMGARTSSLSRMEGLNKSYMNTPGGE
jgi:hypothetical protein